MPRIGIIIRSDIIWFHCQNYDHNLRLFIILLIRLDPNGGCHFQIKRVIDRCRTRKLVIFATNSFLQHKNLPQNYLQTFFAFTYNLVLEIHSIL